MLGILVPPLFLGMIFTEEAKCLWVAYWGAWGLVSGRPAGLGLGGVSRELLEGVVLRATGINMLGKWKSLGA